VSGITLEQFIRGNREELIGRCRVKVSKRSPPSPPSGNEEAQGVPRFLEQVLEELRQGASADDEIANTATTNGRALVLQGLTVGQVVHLYGDVCQSVAELAGELGAPISTEDFRTLNRCLDDTIAGAVTEHARDVSTRRDGEKLEALANTALIAFEALQRGNVGIAGATALVLQRTLVAIRALSLNGPSLRGAETGFGRLVPQRDAVKLWSLVDG
jgi:hypothetical protein